MPGTSTQKIKTDKLSTRGLLDIKSYSAENRTIDVVFATETLDVQRFDWVNDTYFMEQLVLDDTAVNLERLNAGAPVLNDHNKYDGVLGKLGTVVRAWVENGVGKATLKFSRRADVAPVLQDIEDGITTNISVGYRVNKYERQAIVTGEIPIYRAIDWEPYEISFVLIPADIDAKTRSKETDRNDSELIIRNENKKTPNTMTPEELEAKRKQDEANASKIAEERKLAASEAVTAERKRVSDIHDVVRKAKLKEGFALQFIEGGKSVESVREAVIDEIAKEDSEFVIRGSVGPIVGKEDSDKKRDAMENALLHRTNPDKFKLEDGAQEFRGMSLVRMAEESLVIRGVRPVGMSEREIARTALGIGDSTNSRAMSTSDFPNILANVVNKSLQKAYTLNPQTFKPFTTASTSRDFKTKAVLQLSGIVDSFDEVKEGGEYKSSKMNESKEEYKLAKYGKIIPITWETIINDDLSAFNRIPTAIANKALQKQSDIVWGIITANAAMADGTALFHADHGNLAGSGAAINITTLGSARQAMREQTGLEGDKLNLTPMFLIVGTAYEQLANQYTSANYVATKNSDINPAYNQSLTVIVEPRITGNNWYLSASPSMIDTIEYAFLEGEGELFTEQRRGFDVDGLEIKARMVFAAKAIDWRGLYKNAGA